MNLSKEIIEQVEMIFGKKYELEALQEEASTRRYFLIRSGSKKEVLCTDQKINFDFVQLSEFLDQHQVKVPKVLRTNESLGLTFLSWEGRKDLGSLSLTEYQRKIPKVIDLILRLQKLDPPSFVKERRFDTEKLMFEVNLTLDKFQSFSKIYSIETEITSEASAFMEETAGYLDKHPMNVFTHRDFHCRNLLLNEEDGLTLIDFQDARMGLPQYDLASLLYDAYYPLPREYRLEVLKSFQSKSIGGDQKFKEAFYLQALQRSFKALGTYFRMVADEKKMKFLPSILSCLQQLEEIIQLGMFADSLFIFVRSLRNELSKHPEFKSIQVS